MSRNSIFKLRIPRTRLAAIVSVCLGLSLFWACHLNNADSQDHFDLQADSAWSKCDSLMVILEDTNGAPIDTLFNDTLKTLDQLKSLDVGKYNGGKARVRIVGRKAGGLCVEETRGFDDHGGPVVIDTLILTGTKPGSIAITPATVEISVGDPSVEVKAAIKPSFADQIFEWSIDDASVAIVDFPFGPHAGRISVVAQKNGTATLTVRAKQDSTKSAQLIIHVGTVAGRTISVSPDSLALFLGGPDSLLVAHVFPEGTGEAVVWSSGDDKVVTVDALGKVKAVGEGFATVKARFGGASAGTLIKVKRDVPVLTVASKSGAAVNVPITFSPKATQEFGSIVMFKWDLKGDGEWDDSLSGPFLGTSVDLPAQTIAYSAQGHFTAKFLVRDGEGNEAVALVEIDIGNQPPEILTISNDTVISINDLVPFAAKAKDLEGKVIWMGWDYENDGKFDDTLAGNQASLELKGSHKYLKVGVFSAVLRAEDDNHKVRTDTVKVTVKQYPPVANVGHDTTVIAGTKVNFHVNGDDTVGVIVKHELKIGAGPFLNLGKADTSFILPGDSGSVVCIGRVTDDDGNSAVDTMVVTLKVPSKGNNDLAGLVASAGQLAPSFKPVTILYSLQVAYVDSQVTLTASTSDPQAELAVNGKPVASGTPSDPADVKVGTTQDVFKVVVTAQDGTQKTYGVSVTRAPSNDTRLSKLEPVGFALKPVFVPTGMDYADTVAFAVASVSVKPTTNHPAAKVSVNDSLVVSGSSSKAIGLVVGDNLIKVDVTAQDGKTKAAYNVKVVRRAKLILSRIVGAGSSVTMDSLEFPLGTAATVTGKDTLGFHFTKWSITEGAGTLQDSLANPAQLTLKSATVRAASAFVINTYTITTTIAGAVGGVIDHPTITIDHGKDTVLSIATTSYRILSLMENGKPLTPTDTTSKFGDKKYKLGPTTKNRNLVVNFYKTFTVKVTASAGGTVTPQGTTEIDSNGTFNLSMTATTLHFWVSAFTDNTSDSLQFVLGDKMATSTYAIANISGNHELNVTFALRMVQLTVIGSNVSACPPGRLCAILICLPGTVCPPPPDSISFATEYGNSYNISTADSIGKSAFSKWQKNGVDFPGARNVNTGALTGDATFRANYVCTCGKFCCIGVIIISPPILTPIGSTAAPTGTEQIPPLLQSREPVDPN